MNSIVADVRQNTHNSMLTAALEYVAAGYPVFPLHTPYIEEFEDGERVLYCSCGRYCNNIGKHPRTPDGFKSATTDPKQVEAWWSEWPDANIGMPTGAASGVIVIDGDGPTGVTNLEALALSENAPRAETGGGGLHVYLAHPGQGIRIPNSTGKLAESMDVRGDGGYVALPPSLHRSGRRYGWLGGSVTDAGTRGIPDGRDALAERLEDRYGPSEDGHAEPVDGPIIEGARNSTLTSLAGSMRRRGMTEAAILAALKADNEARCVPPLPEPEVRRIARSVARYEPEDRTGSAAQAPRPARPLLVSSFRGRPQPGDRRWMVEGLVPERHATTLYGAGGNAKSLLALHMGMTVADPDADRWLGRLVQTAPVLYLDFELDEEEQARRVFDLADGMGLDEPPADLLYTSALGHTTEEAVAAALRAVEERGVKLVIVDSVGMALEGDAEASKDVIAFNRAVVDPFKAAGATLLLVDHQSKMSRGESYANKMPFGSVYKSNNSRSVIQVQGEWAASVLTATLRHVKSNFGPYANPFNARVVFGCDGIRITHEALTPRQIVAAATNNEDKVLRALEDGPAYPTELADSTGVDPKTVRNLLTRLRKAGKVENTGDKNAAGAWQVRLTEPPY